MCDSIGRCVFVGHGTVVEDSGGQSSNGKGLGEVHVLMYVPWRLQKGSEAIEGGRREKQELSEPRAAESAWVEQASRGN